MMRNIKDINKDIKLQISRHQVVASMGVDSEISSVLAGDKVEEGKTYELLLFNEISMSFKSVGIIFDESHSTRHEILDAMNAEEYELV